jgi:hypothetical protein
VIATVSALVLWLVVGGYLVLLLGVIAPAIIKRHRQSRDCSYDAASRRRLREELARYE